MPPAAAERSRLATGQLLEQHADDDLEQHGAEQAGPAGTLTGRIARGAW